MLYLGYQPWLSEMLTMTKSSLVKARRNEVLLSTQGSRQHLIVLKEGLAKCISLHDGQEIVNDFIMPEGVVIPNRSQPEPLATRMELVLATKGAYWKIPVSAFYQLMDEDKKFHQTVLDGMQQAYHLQALRVQEFQTQNARERYQKLLKNHAKWLQTIRLADIASYLGISQVSLSRIRAGG